MKESYKYIVVVEFPDGSRKEFIAFSEDDIGIGKSFKSGKIVAYRQLSKKTVN